MLLAGVVQSMMGTKTNWARIEYKVPWPHTFAPPEKVKDPDTRLKFDMEEA